jgi:hypothetical protein
MADRSFSVGFNLRALKASASQVRERLSQEHWNLIERTEAQFRHDCERLSSGAEYAHAEALSALLQCQRNARGHHRLADRPHGARRRLAPAVGGPAHRTHDHPLPRARHAGPGARSGARPAGFEAMVALFDSTITFHAQYQQRRDMVALVDLLVMDRDNPRSLAWVVQTLRSRLAKLSQSATPQDAVLAMGLPDPDTWVLTDLSNWQRRRPGSSPLDRTGRAAGRLRSQRRRALG